MLINDAIGKCRLIERATCVCDDDRITAAREESGEREREKVLE
jgi:hypothetical protein